MKQLVVGFGVLWLGCSDASDGAGEGAGAEDPAGGQGGSSLPAGFNSEGGISVSWDDCPLTEQEEGVTAGCAPALLGEDAQSDGICSASSADAQPTMARCEMEATSLGYSVSAEMTLMMDGQQRRVQITAMDDGGPVGVGSLSVEGGAALVTMVSAEPCETGIVEVDEDEGRIGGVMLCPRVTVGGASGSCIAQVEFLFSNCE